MTSVSVTNPFPKCPDKTLIISEVVNSGMMHPDRTACLDTLLFNDDEIRKSCSYAKTNEQCMDNARSMSIFKGLGPQILNCGSLEPLASQLEFCTPGMKTLTNKVISNPSESTDNVTLAREISSVCKFDPPVRPSRSQLESSSLSSFSQSNEKINEIGVFNAPWKSQ
jgi:hypothetical protein